MYCQTFAGFQFQKVDSFYRGKLNKAICLAAHSALLIPSEIWVCGLIQIFPCPSMFRMSAKVVLLNSMISDMSGSFLLMMFLCLWLMLLVG